MIFAKAGQVLSLKNGFIQGNIMLAKDSEFIVGKNRIFVRGEQQVTVNHNNRLDGKILLSKNTCFILNDGNTITVDPSHEIELHDGRLVGNVLIAEEEILSTNKEFKLKGEKGQHVDLNLYLLDFKEIFYPKRRKKLVSTVKYLSELLKDTDLWIKNVCYPLKAHSGIASKISFDVLIEKFELNEQNDHEELKKIITLLQFMRDIEVITLKEAVQEVSESRVVSTDVVWSGRHSDSYDNIEYKIIQEYIPGEYSYGNLSEIRTRYSMLNKKQQALMLALGELYMPNKRFDRIFLENMDFWKK
jgi:hypothetical protein